jgi:hypothetical protein
MPKVGSASKVKHTLICGDVLSVLPGLPRFKCLIADPPDNIGLQYGGYDDKLQSDVYLGFLWKWMACFMRAADIIWVSFNSMYVFDMGQFVTRCVDLDKWQPRLFIQHVTFSQNRRSDCGNGYRPILRLVRNGSTLYPDSIRVPSARQAVYNDRRADPNGCVPLDIWEFPRVCGTFKQKRGWCPTQLHEGLIRRMLLLSTKPGDLVCDAFSGTGTVLRVADGRIVTAIEIDPGSCDCIAEEHGLQVQSHRQEEHNGRV